MFKVKVSGGNKHVTVACEYFSNITQQKKVKHCAQAKQNKMK